MFSQEPVEAEEDDEEGPPPTFEAMFKLFATLSDPMSDGTMICLTASNRWMKHARVLDGENLRETDTGVVFFKYKRRCISMQDYFVFLQDVCEMNGLNIHEVKEMMTNCGDPRKAKAKAVHAKLTPRKKNIDSRYKLRSSTDARTEVSEASGHTLSLRKSKGAGSFNQMHIRSEESKDTRPQASAAKTDTEGAKVPWKKAADELKPSSSLSQISDED